MKKEVLKNYTEVQWLCDICGQRVMQDGHIEFIHEDGMTIFQFHDKCLAEHLKKSFIPHPEKL